MGQLRWYAVYPFSRRGIDVYVAMLPSPTPCLFVTGKGKRYRDAKEFDFAHWKNTEANCQIEGEWSTNDCVVRRQGGMKWEGAAAGAVAAEQEHMKRNHKECARSVSADHGRALTKGWVGSLKQ